MRAQPRESTRRVYERQVQLLYSKAQEAFSLIDEDNDGELTRSEVLRAFRLNARIRELLLPLLPLPAVEKVVQLRMNRRMSHVDVTLLRPRFTPWLCSNSIR